MRAAGNASTTFSRVCAFLAASARLQPQALAKWRGAHGQVTVKARSEEYPSEPRFQITYSILSMSLKERLRLIVQLDGEEAALDSITPVWPAANFYEREIFDLFGVHFGGHPNLRRIMMPEDWKGHPLRKDYPVEGYR